MPVGKCPWRGFYTDDAGVISRFADGVYQLKTCGRAVEVLGWKRAWYEDRGPSTGLAGLDLSAMI